MLSHLLAQAGIENIVVEKRDHETIRNTHRAGILEAQAVAMLTDSGVNGRVLTEGDEHAGIDLRFNGESHPLDFRDLVDATVTLYAQNEVFIDLAAARKRDGGDVRYGPKSPRSWTSKPTPRSSASPTQRAPCSRCTLT